MANHFLAEWKSMMPFCIERYTVQTRKCKVTYIRRTFVFCLFVSLFVNEIHSRRWLYFLHQVKVTVPSLLAPPYAADHWSLSGPTSRNCKSNPITGLDWPWGFQEAEASRMSRQSAHEGGKVVSPTHRPPLPPREYSWYSFLLEAESTPGPQCGRKDYVSEKFQRHHRESNPRPSGL